MPDEPLRPDVEARLLRPTDLVDLTLEAFHCRTEEDSHTSVLVADDDAHLVIHFPPQHIGEQAWESLANGQSEHRSAEPSRLVFAVPSGTRIPWQIDAILAALPDLELSVAAGATPRGESSGSSPEPPAQLETAIEAPYRLVVSPSRGARFQHKARPVGPEGRSELWRTDLDLTDDPAVRGLWARDNDAPLSPAPTPQSLTREDRMAIVKQTHGGDTDFADRPLEVRRLALSSLGAWLDWAGFWDGTVHIVQYRHEAQMGRDSYVRLAYPGILFPFGHRCLLVEVTERRIAHRDHPVAYLWQRRFIVLREPTRRYPQEQQDSPRSNRDNPFATVTIRPLVTPDLDPDPSDGEYPFVVQRGNAPFHFTLETVDRGGQRHTWAAPLVFVPAGNEPGTTLTFFQNGDQASTIYATVSEVAGRAQSLAVAPPVRKGDTSVEVATITFAGTLDRDEMTSWPSVTSINGVLPTMRHLAPTAPTVRMTFNQIYLDEGLPDRKPTQRTAGGPNAGELILNLASMTEINFSGGSDRAGGFVSPNLGVKGLSRSLGAVGIGDLNPSDTAEFAAGNFNPTEFFGAGPLPKLFGLFDLSQILKTTGLEEAPAFSYEAASGRITARLEWSPKITSWGLPSVGPIFVPSEDGLHIDVVVQAAADQAPKVDVSAELVDFRLHLIGDEDHGGLIQLSFRRLGFHAGSAGKPEVDIVFGGIKFVGPLAFVQTLRELIPFDGFSDPPYVDVSPQGVTAGFDLALPNAAVGVFSLENISLGADARVPFLGESALTIGFRFCSKDSPFRITVLCVGGGGWLELRIAPKGLALLELGLEAAAALSVDLGVASGSVAISIGAYLRLEGDKGLLTAYFRIRGEVSVLGLISVSITLELSLAYDMKRDKLHGRASLMVDVEVLFFSASVEIVVERQLPGSRGDPTMRDMLPPNQAGGNDDWIAYCNAFAPLPGR